MTGQRIPNGACRPSGTSCILYPACLQAGVAWVLGAGCWVAAYPPRNPGGCVRARLAGFASFMALRCVSQSHRLAPDWAPERLTTTYHRRQLASGPGPAYPAPSGPPRPVASAPKSPFAVNPPPRSFRPFFAFLTPGLNAVRGAAARRWNDRPPRHPYRVPLRVCRLHAQGSRIEISRSLVLQGFFGSLHWLLSNFQQCAFSLRWSFHSAFLRSLLCAGILGIGLGRAGRPVRAAQAVPGASKPPSGHWPLSQNKLRGAL